MNTSQINPSRDIYTVSRLNSEVGRLLGGSFPLLWIEGEISNFAQPRSGHMYFSLKDESAQVRTAMFRNNNLYLQFRPEDGMQVVVRARVALYEPRGDFQLIAEHMEEAGDGALRRAFELLKQKLFAEGLFDDQSKLPLPDFPRQLGVITSPTGAAIRDVLAVLRRRYTRLPVIIYPVAVQGEAAVSEIIEALKLAQKRTDCDVLLLTRGGGSLEDLQAFNNETVARAIAECTIPVVTGIGHEIDTTIADYVADLRCATPSAAAELISPSAPQLQQQLLNLLARLKQSVNNLLDDRRESIQAMTHRLKNQHPQQRLNLQSQRLDELENRLRRSVLQALQNSGTKLAATRAVLHAHHPARLARSLLEKSVQLQHRVEHALRTLLRNKRHVMDELLRGLDTVSPLNTLKRGYAVVTRHRNGTPLTHSKDVASGDNLDVTLARGKLLVKVEQRD